MSLNLSQPPLRTKLTKRLLGPCSESFKVFALGLVEHESAIKFATEVLEAFYFDVDGDAGLNLRRDGRGHARIVDEK